MERIDTSIYRDIQTPKIMSPFELQAGAQALQQGRDQNRLNQITFAKSDREDSERNALAGAYRDYYAQPNQDPNMLYKSLAGAGQGAAIPGAMKSINDAASSGVKLGNDRLTGQKLQSEISQSQRERSAAKIGAHLNDPELTANKILADLESQVRSGEITVEQGQSMADRIPEDPAQLKPFLSQILASVMKPKDQVDLGFKERALGRQNRNDLILSDGSVNQALVGAKSQIAQAGAVQNYGSPVAGVGVDGKQVFFQPSKGGGAPSIVPGIAPPPKEEKPFTESENNAAGFLGRIKAAEKLIGGLSGGELTEGTALAGAVPFIGDYAQRKAMSPTQQKYKQAADDWIRAKLRKESGAVIGIDESREEYRTYFPQPGDTPELIAQKAQARKQAEAQITQSAGRAGGVQAKNDTPKPTTNGLNQAEAAELAALKKRFGK